METGFFLTVASKYMDHRCKSKQLKCSGQRFQDAWPSFHFPQAGSVKHLISSNYSFQLGPANKVLISSLSVLSLHKVVFVSEDCLSCDIRLYDLLPFGERLTLLIDQEECVQRVFTVH